MTEKIIRGRHNSVILLNELEAIPEELRTEEEKMMLSYLSKSKFAMDELDEKMENKSSFKHYNIDGIPMSTWEWSGYISDLDYKIIKQDRFGPFFVSTVWLGLDHGFNWENNPEYKPLIFETMIFDDEENFKEKKTHELHDFQERYSTKQQAIDGHEKACLLAAKAAHEMYLGRFI